MPMEWNGYSWIGGREGTQQSFRKGASPLPQSPALTLPYTFFDRKGTPFVYLPSKIDTPSTNLLSNKNKSLKHEVFLTSFCSL